MRTNDRQHHEATGTLAARIAQARAEQQLVHEERAEDARGFLEPVAKRDGGTTPKKARSTLAGRLASSRRPRGARADGGDASASAVRDSLIRQRLSLIAHVAGETAAAPATTEAQEAQAEAHDEETAQDLTQARQQIEELRAQVQLVQAEVVSVRRHGELAKAELLRFAKGSTIENMIPVIDSLECALEQVPATLREDPWVEGILMIGESMKALLESEGVERINPWLAPFDPHQHEAVSCVEGEGVPEGVEDNTVITVYRPGYMLNGRVLRPAQVQVAIRKG